MVLPLVAISWYVWIMPMLKEWYMLRHMFDYPGDGKLQFGGKRRSQSAGLLQVQRLDEKHLPKVEGDQRRLVFVGDVHGCRSTLDKLLKEVRYKPETDHLIFTGDIIAKGPNSTGVVDLARDLGASCVRGNHEDKMLLAWDELHPQPLGYPEPSQAKLPKSANEDTAEDAAIKKGGTASRSAKVRELGEIFDLEQIRWLKSLPLILRVGSIPGMGEVLVVHGGLVPRVALEHQDPYYVMNMRSINLESHLPSARRDHLPFAGWEKVWNQYQKMLVKEKRQTVIYGHDAKRGLNIRDYTKGLDSSCVRGGRLTALVVEAGKTEAKQRIVTVRCRDKV